MSARRPTSERCLLGRSCSSACSFVKLILVKMFHLGRGRACAREVGEDRKRSLRSDLAEETEIETEISGQDVAFAAKSAQQRRAIAGRKIGGPTVWSGRAATGLGLWT